MAMLKECETKECQKKLQQVQWTSKKKEKDHPKDGKMR
jgi:hypothetical protein